MPGLLALNLAEDLSNNPLTVCLSLLKCKKKMVCTYVPEEVEES